MKNFEYFSSIERYRHISGDQNIKYFWFYELYKINTWFIDNPSQIAMSEADHIDQINHTLLELQHRTFDIGWTNYLNEVRAYSALGYTPFDFLKIPITNSNQFFLTIFYLHLLTMEVNAIQRFLSEQFEANFSSDFAKFSVFLKKGIDDFFDKSFLDIEEKTKNYDPRIREISVWMYSHEKKETDINTSKVYDTFTQARQVLAIHYIMEELKVEDDVPNTKKGEFLQFLLRRDYDELRKAIAKPFGVKSSVKQKDDLRFIKQYFENLGLGNIVRKINNDLSPE